MVTKSSHFAMRSSAVNSYLPPQKAHMMATAPVMSVVVVVVLLLVVVVVVLLLLLVVVVVVVRQGRTLTVGLQARSTQLTHSTRCTSSASIHVSLPQHIRPSEPQHVYTVCSIQGVRRPPKRQRLVDSP